MARYRFQEPDGLRAFRPFVPALLIVVVQMVAFPAGTGPWSLGIVSGLLTALVALGLALIYRANRILNFAQAVLGTVPTTVAVGLVAVSGLPWVVGAFLGLAVAIVLGAVVEFFIIRRFSRSPRLLLTVATIGLSQLLVVAGTLLPRWWGKTIFAGERLPDPFQVSFDIGNQTFGGTEVLALITAPLLIAGLALFAPLLGSATAMFKEKNEIEAALATFLVSASGITLYGVGAPFWGLVAGLVLYGARYYQSMRKPHG